jgi:hypothetical protein
VSLVCQCTREKEVELSKKKKSTVGIVQTGSSCSPSSETGTAHWVLHASSPRVSRMSSRNIIQPTRTCRPRRPIPIQACGESISFRRTLPISMSFYTLLSGLG